MLPSLTESLYKMEGTSASKSTQHPLKKKRIRSYSEDAQQLIINCHANVASLLGPSCVGSISRTSELLEV